MALATQCPHCQTTFRVAHDQLKLRAGLVRCGHCKEIFNGIEHLLPPEDAEATEAGTEPTTRAIATPPPYIAPAVTAPASSDLPAPDEEKDAEDASAATPDAPAASSRLDFDIPAAFEREAELSPLPAPQDEDKPDNPNPLERMTLMDFTQDRPDQMAGDENEIEQRELSNAESFRSAYDPTVPDELDEAIEDLQRKPWRSTKKTPRTKKREVRKDSEPEDEPGFVRRGRRQQRMGRRLRILLGISCFILLIAALLQGSYLFRNQIAGLFPQAKPFLTQVCDALGCRIDLPAQIAAVSIESSELQTLAENKNTFVLTTLLRNYSDSLQQWPHIELTLNDANEKPLLRRVFKPADYLSEAEVRAGFATSSEQSAKLSFELEQIKASGYRVYLFYP